MTLYLHVYSRVGLGLLLTLPKTYETLFEAAKVSNRKSVGGHCSYWLTVCSGGCHVVALMQLEEGSATVSQCPRCRRVWPMSELVTVNEGE